MKDQDQDEVAAIIEQRNKLLEENQLLRKRYCINQPKMVDGMPRRCRIDLDTLAEHAIRQAIHAVEAAGAHPLLTEAVILLGQAKDKVSDFLEI